MKITIEQAKKEINESAYDKMDNLCGGGQISDYLYSLCVEKNNLKKIKKNALYIVEHNYFVRGGFRFYEGFLEEELILDYSEINKLSGQEREERIISDALYNYDAFWIMAIAIAFKGELGIDDSEVCFIHLSEL